MGVEAALDKAAEDALGLDSPDAKNLAEQAASLFNKAEGLMNGYVLFTRIKYKTCVCGTLFNLWQNHWPSGLNTQTPWQKYSKGGDFGLNDGIYFDAADAYKKGNVACKEQLKAWAKDNKNNIENH